MSELDTKKLNQVSAKLAATEIKTITKTIDIAFERSAFKIKSIERKEAVINENNETISALYALVDVGNNVSPFYIKLSDVLPDDVLSTVEASIEFMFLGAIEMIQRNT